MKPTVLQVIERAKSEFDEKFTLIDQDRGKDIELTNEVKAFLDTFARDIVSACEGEAREEGANMAVDYIKKNSGWDWSDETISHGMTHEFAVKLLEEARTITTKKV